MIRWEFFYIPLFIRMLCFIIKKWRDQSRISIFLSAYKPDLTWRKRKSYRYFHQSSFFKLFFYKITDHTCNPKTNFRKLDQKIHSCYFQNMA